MSALFAFRLERIAGIATFTMETSSSTMKKAVITLASASHRRGSSSAGGGVDTGATGAAVPGAGTASVISVIVSLPIRPPRSGGDHLARVPGTRRRARSPAGERPIQGRVHDADCNHREHGRHVV